MNDTNAVAILSALAQSTRLGVFRMLIGCGEAGMPAGVIAKKLGVPQNTLSAHLNILSNAGLIGSQRSGRSLIYSVQTGLTKDFIGYLVNDCCGGHPEICDIQVNNNSGTKPEG
jgi:ArsR family transcriptional regulator, arsenate/arsenite/antimonite-responsive transcriptional repressor